MISTVELLIHSSIFYKLMKYQLMHIQCLYLKMLVIPTIKYSDVHHATRWWRTSMSILPLVVIVYVQLAMHHCWRSVVLYALPTLIRYNHLQCMISKSLINQIVLINPMHSRILKLLAAQGRLKVELYQLSQYSSRDHNKYNTWIL